MVLTSRVAVTALSALAFACTSEITSPGSPNSQEPSPTMTGGGSGGSAGGGTTLPPGELTPEACQGQIAPGRTPLRRLTGPEYNNTVKALLDDTSAPANKFPPPEESAGFLNNADAYTTTELHVEAYLTAAETLAASYRKTGALNLPCAADAQGCATTFIEDFGKKAFRRPLTDAEVTSYLARFNLGLNGGSFEEGLEWVVGRFLQSPHFLYRVELETEGKPAGTVVPLSDYSMASRLSYFLWSSMPDAELFAAADAHLLSTVEGVAAQATRMMASAAFAATVSSFHQQWSGWDAVYGAEKTATTTPTWDGALQADMIHESELFVQSVFDAKGTFRDLLTASHTFVNPALAQFYGITYPGAGTDFVRVDNVPHRHGILTSPAILAGHAHPNQSAPVKRGELIRKHLLCTDPPPPPANLMIKVPEVVPGSTTKERFAAHRTQASCNGCHVLLDPLGIPLENYDELGRWRDTDQGKPVDASGGLTMVASLGDQTDPALVPVNGPAELGEKLAALPEAQQCLVFNWFRYATGHTEEQADTCTLNALITRFAGSQQNLSDLLIGVASSDGFRYRVELPQ
jgi:hypothetical protein